MTNRTPRRDLANLHHEVLVGGAVGLIAGATFALYFGASLAGFAFGAVLGLATGVTVGTLLWIGSADLPDAPIAPVQTSRRRSMH
jgi:hypothetical protein